MAAMPLRDTSPLLHCLVLLALCGPAALQAQTRPSSPRAETTNELTTALNAVRAKFAAYPLIPAMKSAIASATQDAQWARVRPPLEALDAMQQEALQQALRSAAFAIDGLA